MRMVHCGCAVTGRGNMCVCVFRTLPCPFRRLGSHVHPWTHSSKPTPIGLVPLRTCATASTTDVAVLALLNAACSAVGTAKVSVAPGAVLLVTQPGLSFSSVHSNPLDCSSIRASLHDQLSYNEEMWSETSNSGSLTHSHLTLRSKPSSLQRRDSIADRTAS